ncbi:MAG TPA: hypothetical protein VNJ51_09430 [Candidatus Dormibacteraeota bacterium]|nr:hypothetical protein [Candidatus Dormibacteraeota bacterium]
MADVTIPRRTDDRPSFENVSRPRVRLPERYGEGIFRGWGPRL